MQTLDRPEITLIVLSSADGCSVSQDSATLDQNKNWKDSNAVQSIIYQFFDFSKNSDVYNVITGEVVTKMGVNRSDFTPKKSKVRLVVLDHDQLLTALGIHNLAQSVYQLIVAVPDGDNAIFGLKQLPPNCHLLTTDKRLNLKKLVVTLKKDFQVKKLTIQSASILNSQWLQSGIVDHLTLIVYPLLVSNNGSPAVPSMSIFDVKSLTLKTTRVFDGNYVSLQYDVINQV